MGRLPPNVAPVLRTLRHPAMVITVRRVRTFLGINPDAMYLLPVLIDNGLVAGQIRVDRSLNAVGKMAVPNIGIIVAGCVCHRHLHTGQALPVPTHKYS